MVLEIFTLIDARNEHFAIHSVPEAQKYKQNEKENTDIDYKYINRKKQELPSES